MPPNAVTVSFDQPLAIRLAGDVGGQGARFAAARTTFLRQDLEPLAIARRQREARTAAGQFQSQRAADAFGGTGQNDPASLGMRALRPSRLHCAA